MKSLPLLNCLRGILAALGAFLVLSSRAVAGAPAPETLPESSSPPIISTHNLEGLVITTTVLAPQYNSAKVDFSFGSEHHLSTRLFPGSNELSYSNRAKDSFFSVDLIFLPYSGPCLPGGLYLRSVKVMPSKDSPTVVHTNRTIAAWSSSGQLIEPWFTPFDTPQLVAQSAARQLENGDHLSSLALWTYGVTYRSLAIPPTNCPVVTKVELKLTSVDDRIPSRTYHYTVTEQYKKRRVYAEISAAEPDAPGAVIAIDENGASDLTRRVTFKGLDALRDAKAQVALSFEQSPQAKSVAVSFPSDLSPRIQIITQLDITAGKPAAPLAAYLARLFSDLTAPLLSASSGLTPSVPVRIVASLSTTPANSVPVMRPLRLMQTILTSGKDDSDCTSASTSGLSCTLAAAMEKAAFEFGPPDPAASYHLEIVLPGGAKADELPLLGLRVVVPLAKVVR